MGKWGGGGAYDPKVDGAEHATSQVLLDSRQVLAIVEDAGALTDERQGQEEKGGVRNMKHIDL